MSFFDTSHLVGLEGSAGPPVSFSEMVSQGFQQQFRVDAARALDDELRNRWLESLRAAQVTGGDVDPDDPWAYRAFSQHVKGQPIDTFDPNKTLWDYDPTKRIKGMIDANEKIKALNNPEIKSFEQILEEVAQMQHEVEGETASMYERSGTGGFVASLLGAIGGSFTTRDPLNIITAPIGAGRTVATRIAAEMGIAGAVVGYTELAEVAPARQIAGLPERDPLFNIAAATLGAGVIRGGIEGIGYGLRRLRSEDIDFDLRDSQLAQMFEANVEKPSARAGLSILDDTKFIERNNPYGEGQQANVRFLAELQAVQRAMNGEPMTAVARVLPPIPYEQLKKAADFEIVREQAPQVYARMEAAQAKVAEIEGRLSNNTATYFHGTNQTFDKFEVKGFRRGISFVEDKESADHYGRLRAKQLGYGEGRTIEASLDVKKPLHVDETNDYEQFIDEAIKGGYDAIIGPSHAGPNAPKNITVLDPAQIQIIQRPSQAERRTANAEYQAAYRAVEAEAARINKQQIDAEAVQQRQSTGVLLATAEGRPFLGPTFKHDYVEDLADRINAFNDKLDEATAARFVRETFGEGENKVEVEVWEKDGGIDIGLKDPVDPNFRFETDEGEMTVAAAMRDLQDDTDLDEAMRTCLL